jgi:hypothetical protein
MVAQRFVLSSSIIVQNSIYRGCSLAGLRGSDSLMLQVYFSIITALDFPTHSPSRIPNHSGPSAHSSMLLVMTHHVDNTLQAFTSQTLQSLLCLLNLYFVFLKKHKK